MSRPFGANPVPNAGLGDGERAFRARTFVRYSLPTVVFLYSEMSPPHDGMGDRDPVAFCFVSVAEVS